MSASATQRLRVWLYAVLIAAAVSAAWSNCRRAPFILDDEDSTVNNPTIQNLRNWRAVLSPPHGGLTVSGRPLLNASLALNWALAGPDVSSYHLFNVVGHLGCALLLYGLARRSLLRVPALASRASGLAASIALLWAVHPLQTESVTYIVQRAEMLMGLFYLGTLYAVARGAEALEQDRRGRAAGWTAAAVAACFLGMLSKEVMVSAPVMALLCDAAFFSGSVRAAWRRRRGLWLLLAACWIPLFLLVTGNGQRGGTSGFGVGIRPWEYWWTQGPAMVRYLRLSIWPHPLILDYGFERRWLERPWLALPANLLLAALIAAAWPLWRRRRAWGWLLIWFLVILAPTSIVPGNRQTVAEHRMYLALVPVLAVAVGAASGVLLRKRRGTAAGAVLIALLTCGGVAGVRARNREYLDPERMWRQAIAQTPGNLFAHLNLGATLYFSGRWDEAAAEFRRAIAIDPTHSASHSNLGVLYQARGDPQHAMEEYRLALDQNSRSHQAWNNLGISLAALGRWSEAADCYRKAIALNPFYADALANLGIACRALSDLSHSEEYLRIALAANPRKADAWYHLGMTLRLERKLDQAILAEEGALRLEPGFAAAHSEWGQALMARGSPAEARRQFAAALTLTGPNADTELNLGLAEAALGNFSAAVAHYDQAIQLKPSYSDAYADRAAALLAENRPAEAARSLERAVELDPASAIIHYDLGLAYRQLGRAADAVAQYRAALGIDPDLYQAENNLAALLASQGRLEEAIALLRKVVQHHPEFRIAQESLDALVKAAAARQRAH